MKRLITLLLAIFCIATLQAQSPKRAYCTIRGSETGSVAGRLHVDYGQDDNRLNWLVDKNGNSIHFKTLVQALNYLTDYGWELDEVQNSYDNPTYWILVKEVNSEAEITEGIYTRRMYKDEHKGLYDDQTE